MSDSSFEPVILDLGSLEPFVVKPVVLEDDVVRLEPMGVHHAEGLLRATDEETFAYFPLRPDERSVEGFEEYVVRRTGAGFVSFCVLVDEEVAGASSYFDIRAEHRGVEVGHTFLARSVRGGAVNARIKRLMIGHAIETLGAVRVQLKTDGRNLASQAAMRRMGFPYEGVLRSHLVMPDGVVRDTVMFGVTPRDWAGVRGQLEEVIRERGGVG